MSEISHRSQKTAFAIVTILFFMWGFITVFVDALIPRLKDVFELTYFQAGLVQLAFFGAYFMISIPGGSLISRIGYRHGIIVGLLVMATGCFLFFPAAHFRVYPVFLLALFVLAGGMTLLQVSANPYVVALGPVSTSSSRLTLSQAFNSLGTAIAPLFAAAYILGSQIMSSDERMEMSADERLAYFQAEASAVQLPFLVIGLILISAGIFFALVRLPDVRNAADEASVGNKWKWLLTQRRLMMGTLCIFLYVGAEVAIGSYIVNYFLSIDIPSELAQTIFFRGIIEQISGQNFDTLSPGRIAGTLVTFYWTGAMAGRFAGAALSRFFKPSGLLAVYAVCAAGLCLVTSMSTGVFAMSALLAIGFFNSIMFPTIFSLAINSLKRGRSEGSGILCTAIVGGAVIPPMLGMIADSLGFSYAFMLPAACYLCILGYGLLEYLKINPDMSAVAE